jgi:RNA polymerase sigma-70 factor, ECF subfamily
MEIAMTYCLSKEAKKMTESLIERAQHGDEEALGMIFEQHHLFVYKFIYAMLGNHTLAEELTQETFLGAFKSVGSIKNDSTLRTWLCAIAKNTTYTFFRRNKREGQRSPEEIEQLRLVDIKTPSPDRQLLNNELNKVILSALGKLSEDKRTVFIFREMQDLSYQEISEITGDSISKLKTDLYRAKIEMKAILRSYVEVKK